MTLSDSAEPGLFGETLYVQRDQHGRYFTTTINMDGIAVFDSTGRFLKKLGRQGSGPGEFRAAMLTQPPPNTDSMYIHDIRQARLTVIGPDLTIGREARVSQFPDLVLPGGYFIAARQIPTAENIGYPIHTMSAEGTIIRSFGVDTPQFRADLKEMLNRVVGPAQGGMIWAARPAEFIFEEWEPMTGTRVTMLEPKSAHFIAPTGPTLHPFVARPSSYVLQIREDALGYLWVLTRTADANWHALWDREPTHNTPVGYDQYDAVYDWVLDVIDIRTSTIVASKRFDHAVWTRPPNELLISRSAGVDDNVSFDLWRPVLTPLEEKQ